MKSAPLPLMTRNMERPALSTGAVLASILGFWLFYVIIVSLRAAVLGFEHQGELAFRRIIVTVMGIALTILLWRILSLFDEKRLGVRITAASILALPSAFLLVLINYYIFNIYDAESLLTEKEISRASSDLAAMQEIAEMTISRYFFFIAWSALYIALTFANDVRESERRAAMFAQAAQVAELRALRYQVNPHFLFNTLNSLSSLVLKDSKAEAETMILNLSNFFRSSLTGDATADVSLADEVQLQRLYLQIEAVRFPKRLQTRIDLPLELENAAVPSLILQPLVENAIKYGVSRTSEPVEIAISAARLGNELVLTVSDNAPPPKGHQIAQPDGAGIGLRNVRDRLAARFGEAGRLQIKQPVAGGFVVTLNMPVVIND